MTDTLLRFNDLKTRKIVTNHPTLRRWIEQEGFPPGRWLGPNTRVWTETEINQWLLNRPYARADMMRRTA
jgi:predicted DNA-binding transcriptional regulator AlpA